ncbi:MAG: DUF4860 domain-containing protein [Lachnospiraceae bacterium]
MNRQENRHCIDLVFVILLFAVFAGSVLVVLAAETGGYQRMLTGISNRSDLSTLESYVAQKVRQTGNASAGTFDGASALVLTQDINGTSYVTVLYTDGTILRELFCEETTLSGFTKGAGEEVCACTKAEFTAVPDTNLIRADVGTSGGEDSFLLAAAP